MGAYNYFTVSDDSRNHRRRLERAKRARDKKREQIQAALRKAGLKERVKAFEGPCLNPIKLNVWVKED